MNMDNAVNFIILLLLIIIVAGIALLVSAEFRSQVVDISGNNTSDAVTAIDNLNEGIVTFTSFGQLWGLLGAVGVLLALVFGGIIGVLYLRRRGYM